MPNLINLAPKGLPCLVDIISNRLHVGPVILPCYAMNFIAKMISYACSIDVWNESNHVLENVLYFCMHVAMQLQWCLSKHMQ